REGTRIPPILSNEFEVDAGLPGRPLLWNPSAGLVEHSQFVQVCEIRVSTQCFGSVVWVGQAAG
ncbi:MAG TPA: hypothetical protein VIK52_11855, partial [Opitutaceae bacterium]